MILYGMSLSMQLVTWFMNTINTRMKSDLDSECKSNIILAEFESFIDNSQNHFMVEILLRVPLRSIDLNDIHQRDLIKKMLFSQYRAINGI